MRLRGWMERVAELAKQFHDAQQAKEQVAIVQRDLQALREREKSAQEQAASALSCAACAIEEEVEKSSAALEQLRAQVAWDSVGVLREDENRLSTRIGDLKRRLCEAEEELCSVQEKLQGTKAYDAVSTRFVFCFVRVCVRV